MSIGIWQILLVLVIILIIFGAGKLPKVMGDLAKGVTEFRKGLRDTPDEEKSTTSQSTAALNEGACRLLPGRPEPTLFRLGVAMMAKDFSLDIGRAREYLDYDPQVSLWTALDEFCQWWKAHHPG